MATAHEHAVNAEAHLARAVEYGPGQPGAAHYVRLAQVHVDLAKVRLELEARAAENARTDRLLAEVKPSPRSLDPRRNRKGHQNRTANKKPSPGVTGEGS